VLVDFAGAPGVGVSVMNSKAPEYDLVRSLNYRATVDSDYFEELNYLLNRDVFWSASSLRQVLSEVVKDMVYCDGDVTK
jgi:hypothetical protein